MITNIYIYIYINNSMANAGNQNNECDWLSVHIENKWIIFLGQTKTVFAKFFFWICQQQKRGC